MMVLFNVQMSCRQRAAVAALALPMGPFDTPCVRLARCRSWAPWGQAKTEGKIKGPARACPQSQSARGVAAARRLLACVPSRCANPEGIGLGRVPCSMWYATLRRSVCYGNA
ncbi:MAG: hypothetical protein Q7K57_21700 [Burkholderiaceae bacterium]|nr:hypothetical protein [Burkholderiaceae bacterium]